MAIGRFTDLSPRERLVHYIQELERLHALKGDAADHLKEAFDAAKSEGYDTTTLKVVLKLRKMTPNQRQERRALEAIYLAALGMLEGDALPEAARRRLDRPSEPEQPSLEPAGQAQPSQEPESTDSVAREPEQPPLIIKDPAEARAEGADAAAAGRRIYDNPYPAGDPCRAAWDEGWCGQNKSNGMETPSAFQRRGDKPARKPEPEAGAPSDAPGDAGETSDAKKGAA